MGLLRSLAMLLIQAWLFCCSRLKAQSVLPGSSTSPARALDAILQDYAYRAFVRPRTGIPFDGDVPLNLTGIKIAAMRLRRGSLRIRGVRMYKEFEIPEGVVVQPYVERLVLVYQNLGNWSEEYYPPLPGYTYLAPVLGLLAYNASDLTATNLPELDLRVTGDPIRIKFTNVETAPNGTVAKCIWFDLQGVTNFSNLLSGDVCSSIQQGHFSIVVESPNAPPPARPPTSGGTNSKVWVIVGSLLGGALLVVILVLLILCAKRYRQRKKVKRMERAAEGGENLRMSSVGDVKAPSAMATRTQPAIETEYVP